MTPHEWAQRYLELGYHPIPCAPKQKRPLVAWKDFQVVPPTIEQVAAWWSSTTPDANIALVLGRGVFAVDLDGGMDAAVLLSQRDVFLPDDAPRSKTGNGFHVFLSSYNQVGDRVGLLSTHGAKPQVDIRGIGIVVVPPSIHPNGSRYEWEVPLVAKPPHAPLALMDLIGKTAAAPVPVTSSASPSDGGSWVIDALSGAPEGQRDATCTRLAGYLLHQGIDPVTAEAILLQSFARNCAPHFDARDVRKCVQSIARRERTLQSADHVIRPKHIGTVLESLETQRQAGPPPVVETPFPNLNEFLNGGFAPGELIYLGARPGVGKTVMGLECARRAGKRGTAVLAVSREMVVTSLARRMVAQEGPINATTLKRSLLGRDDEQLYQAAVRRLKALPIWLTDEVVSIAEIVSVMEHAPQPIQFLIVDYLQLVRASKDIKERRLQVEEVSQTLKTLALQYQIPVLCLSSLSRPANSQGKDEPEPTLSSLRESGELEHDADVVLLLHRQPRKPETTCIVAKNREGRVGRCYFQFDYDHVAFLEAIQRSES